MQTNLKGSYPHIVEMQDDLMHLAEIFYGATDGWKDIYWANLDVYGDDFEKIPVGTTIHIPIFEDKDANHKWQGHFYGTNSLQAIIPPAPAMTPNNYQVLVANSGQKNLVVELYDGSSVMLGVGGVAYAKDSLAVSDDTLSNAMGDTAPTIILSGNADMIGYSAAHKGIRLSHRDSNETLGYIPIIIQQIAILFYGSDVYQWDLWRANKLNPENAIHFNQIIHMPSRAKKYNLELAHRWKVNLGNT
jgi:hypothetical protein